MNKMLIILSAFIASFTYASCPLTVELKSTTPEQSNMMRNSGNPPQLDMHNQIVGIDKEGNEWNQVNMWKYDESLTHANIFVGGRNIDKQSFIEAIGKPNGIHQFNDSKKSLLMVNARCIYSITDTSFGTGFTRPVELYPPNIASQYSIDNTDDKNNYWVIVDSPKKSYMRCLKSPEDCKFKKDL